MLDQESSRKIFGNVDQDRILALEQAAIRIPSSLSDLAGRNDRSKRNDTMMRLS